MHNSAYFNSLEEVAMEIAAIGGATSYNASGASQTTTAASGSSGSGKVYDKKDSNEDGIEGKPESDRGFNQSKLYPTGEDDGQNKRSTERF
jgi:hypothetical protein